MLPLNSHNVPFLFICDSRPDIYTLYIEEPDSSGHSYGPVSAGVSSFYIFLTIALKMVLHYGLNRFIDLKRIVDEKLP